MRNFTAISIGRKEPLTEKQVKKPLTLKQFEYRYTPRLIRIAKQVKDNTIYHKYLQLPEEKKYNNELISALKTLDVNANVNWPLMHMGSAHRYLGKDKGQIDATGRHQLERLSCPQVFKKWYFSRSYIQNKS